MKREYETSENLNADLALRVQKELKLGYLNLSDGFFMQAETNFALATQLDPTCADGFWGMMLVRLEATSEDLLYSNPLAYKNALSLSECQKALECASETLKKKYEDLLSKIYVINEGNKY